MTEQPVVSVNGIVITPQDIENEVLGDEVIQKIVARELLIQRAVDLGLCDRDVFFEDESDVFGDLLKQEIKISTPDIEACREYYEKNISSFMTSPQFEAVHILFPAQPSDYTSRAKAGEKAEEVLCHIQKDINLFENIKSLDKRLYIRKCGEANDSPALLAALSNMEEGDISKTPVLSEFGYHLLKLYKRIEGDVLPFRIVEGWISEHIKNHDWQVAFVEYLQKLADKAEIKGAKVSMLGAAPP